MKKPEKLSKWGIGPKLVSFTLLYGLVIYFISIKYFSFTNINAKYYYVLNLSGISLIVLGFIYLIPAGRHLNKGILKDTLVKTSFFSFVRNPIYSAWLFFIMPGFVLLSKNLLMLSCPIFMYFLFTFLIKKEENYLEKHYGEEYIEYKRNVNSLIPNIFKLISSLRQYSHKNNKKIN